MSRITTNTVKKERKKKTVACLRLFHFIQIKQISINEYYINNGRMRGTDRQADGQIERRAGISQRGGVCVWCIRCMHTI